MNYTEQLRIAEIIRQLLTDGETFSAALARELLNLVPPANGSVFGLSIKTKGLSGGFSGLASNGEQVRIDDDEMKTAIDTRQKPLWCGKYAVRRQDESSGVSTVHIEDRFIETRDLDERDGSWSLEYINGEPTVLKAAKLYTFRIPLWRSQLSFALSRYVKWKTPA